MFHGYKIAPEMIVQQQDKFYLLPTVATIGTSIFVIAAPWCGHCRALAKTLQIAATTYGLNVMYMIGDESESTSRVMKAMNAQGFPTIYRVKPGGELVLYNGPRTPSALAGYQ